MFSSSSASAQKQQSGPSADGEVTPSPQSSVLKQAASKPKLKYVPNKCSCKGERQKVLTLMNTLGYEKALEKEPALLTKAKREGWLGRKFFVKSCNGRWRAVGGKKVTKKTSGKPTTERDRLALYNHMVAANIYGANGIELMCRGIEFSRARLGISGQASGQLDDFIGWLRKAKKEGWLTLQLAVTPTGADHKIPVGPRRKRSREEMTAAAKKRRKVLTSEVERLRAEAESAAKELEMFEVAEELVSLREEIAQRKVGGTP